MDVGYIVTENVGMVDAMYVVMKTKEQILSEISDIREISRHYMGTKEGAAEIEYRLDELHIELFYVTKGDSNE